MIHFPKIIELLEHEVREEICSSVPELVDSISKKLERADNFWVVIGNRQ